jgi:hypothetical protein
MKVHSATRTISPNKKHQIHPELGNGAYRHRLNENAQRYAAAALPPNGLGRTPISPYGRVRGGVEHRWRRCATVLRDQAFANEGRSKRVGLPENAGGAIALNP